MSDKHQIEDLAPLPTRAERKANKNKKLVREKRELPDLEAALSRHRFSIVWGLFVLAVILILPFDGRHAADAP